MHIIWFHLHKTQENSIFIYNDRKQLTNCMRIGWRTGSSEKVVTDVNMKTWGIYYEKRTVSSINNVGRSGQL